MRIPWDSSPTYWKIIQAVIYSFHMPLFFILSGMTSKFATDYKSFGKNVVKGVKHLIVPALILFSIFIVNDIVRNPTLFTSIDFWKGRIQAIFYYRTMDGVGASWFFVALFIAKVIFDFLHLTIPKKYLLPVVLLTSCLGVVMGKIPSYPYAFSFDIGLAISIFLYVGYNLKNFKMDNWKLSSKVLGLILTFILWLGIAVWNYHDFLDIGQRRYPIFPLCFALGIAGSILTFAFAKLLEKAKIFVPLQLLGRYGIYFYCVHSMDYIWEKWWRITSSNFLDFLTRFAIDLAFFLVLIGVLFIIQIVKKNIHTKQKEKGISTNK